jgi:hypothetical protein
MLASAKAIQQVKAGRTELPHYTTNLRHGQRRLPLAWGAPLLVGRNKADRARQQRSAFSAIILAAWGAASVTTTG